MFCRQRCTGFAEHCAVKRTYHRAKASGVACITGVSLTTMAIDASVHTVTPVNRQSLLDLAPAIVCMLSLCQESRMLCRESTSTALSAAVVTYVDERGLFARDLRIKRRLRINGILLHRIRTL